MNKSYNVFVILAILPKQMSFFNFVHISTAMTFVNSKKMI